MPELVLLEVDERLATAEPDPEIQELIAASVGTNLGVDFLPGSLPFTGDVDPGFAADVVWFDGLITNVDRTPRNPNLLRWRGDPWLIDHGAALYTQHRDGDFAATAEVPFAMLVDHVLLPQASSIVDADLRLAPRVEPLLDAVARLVPDAWLTTHPRAAYVEHLRRRLAGERTWVSVAEGARG